MGSEGSIVLWILFGGTSVVVVLIGGILALSLKSNARIRRSQRFTQRLIDTTPAFIVLFTPDGKIVQSNQSFSALAESLESKAKDENFFAMFSPPREKMTDLDEDELLHVESEVDFSDKSTTSPSKDGKRHIAWTFRRFGSALTQNPSIIGTGVDITERKRIEQQVRRHQKDLRELSSRVLHAQEKERERIAHELHDDLGQALTAIRINLVELEMDVNQSDLDRITERIDDSKSLIESSLNQIRRLAHELRPSLLDDLGLTSAVRWYVNQFQRRLGLDLEFTASGDQQRIAREVEIVVYRIIQEACTNIAKHADATRVAIQLDFSPDQLSVTIEDNGKGFLIPTHENNNKPTEQGFGLLGMQERAHTIGGSLDIESAPGRGTKIRLSLPKEAIYV